MKRPPQHILKDKLVISPSGFHGKVIGVNREDRLVTVKLETGRSVHLTYTTKE